MKTRPLVDVFQERKTGNFRILRYTVNPESGFTVGFGRLISIPLEQMRSEGLALLRQHLDQFPAARTDEACEIQGLSPEDRRRFRRDNKLVRIEKADEHLLYFDPMALERSGWVSIRTSPIEVKLPIKQSTFIDLLIKAFDLSQ
jgi:hypothetical protein